MSVVRKDILQIPDISSIFVVLWSNVRTTGLFSACKLVSPFGVTRFHQ